MTDIPRLPDEVRATLALEAQAYLTALEAVVSELRVELDILHQQNSELLARTRQTSRNSSRPPSSDPPSAPSRSGREASPRKRGAQPGHKQHKRIMLPVDKVDEVIDHHPVECP